MLSLRVTTGTAKNRKVRSPDISGFRAVQEVAKSAIFSILGKTIVGATCLDLFAGSGNMGIEALSRGAEWCDFVDENHKAVKTIEDNLQNAKLNEKAEVHKESAVKFVANCPGYYDIIFIDPFYKDIKHRFLMELLQEVLNKDGVIIFLHGNNLDMEDLLKKTHFKIARTERYGKSFVDFLVRD